MKRAAKITYKILLHIFAIIGVILVGGFFAIRFHWTDVGGVIDANSEKYAKVLGVSTTKAASDTSSDQLSLSKLSDQIDQLSKTKEIRQKNLCAIDAIGSVSPINARNILDAYFVTKSDPIVSKMIFAVTLRLQASGNSAKVDACSQSPGSIGNTDYTQLEAKYQNASGNNIFPWMNDDQWKTIETAIVKDKDEINQAAGVAGIEPRLVVASAIVEQVRLFHAERELFKQFFQPLQILGNANKISLGIMGVKEQTAIDTENNLKDPSSPYYLGPDMEHALDFPTGVDAASERYNRLTDEKNHYYSYLYGAIYMKEIMSQWKNAGYDISYRPEIAGTLFNVGFPQSKPNSDPKVGGSQIDVGDAKYTFGSLSYEFYYSGELLDAFPYIVN
jgi:hypothetical protein